MHGFGSKLVGRMARQLGGDLSYDWQASGVVVTLRMRKDRLAT
jgi:two-component sensor histidine kinase